LRIPDEVIMDIKYRNPIEDVIAPYVALKRAGKNLKGLCPFHSEKTPSFTVYPDSNSYYCYGCGNGGDVVTFIKNIENLDYVEALKLLADRAGVTIPESGYDDSMFKLKAKLYEINREAAKFYYNYMFTKEGMWAYKYLTDRGLSKETITHFGLGCAPNAWDGLINHLKAKGYSLFEMENAGVVIKGNKGYYDRFRNKVMFPIIDLQKRVIGFSGRKNPNDLLDKGGKYINTSDTLIYKKSHHLFGMNHAKAHCNDRIILVEGNMDVISLHQAGFKNAVAALGTSFTDEQARLISRYTNEIVLIMDSDAAGQKATDRAMTTLAAIGINTRVVNIPDGKDPDEFIKNNGADKFAALLEGASSDIDYKLYKAASGLDLEANADKVAYLNKAADILAESSDEIAIDMYAGRLSEKYSVSKATLLEKIKENKQKLYKKQKNNEIKSIISPKISRDLPNPDSIKYKRAVAAEETILGIMLKHPDVIKNIEVTQEDFVSSLCKKIFADIKELDNRNASIDISLIASEYTASENGYITGIAIKSVVGDQYKQMLKDAINVLKEEKLKTTEGPLESMGDDDWTKYMNNLIEKKVKKDGWERKSIKARK